MSSALVAAPGSAPARVGWKPRLIPQWHANPKIVQFSTTVQGRALLLSFFGFLLYFSTPYWLWALTILAGTSLIPRLRTQLLGLGAVGMTLIGGSAKFSGLIHSHQAWAPYVSALACVLVFGVLLSELARRLPRSTIARRPLLTIVFSFAVLTVFATLCPMPDPLRSGVRLGVIMIGGYLWYFAYSVKDQAAQTSPPLRSQLWTWAPVWTNANGAGTPIGKGAAYLCRVEAKNPEELAITQLKGVQLLMWCVLLRLLSGLFRMFAFGPDGLRVPALDDLLASPHLPEPYICWAALVAGFGDTLLSMAVWGNTIVAGCRMAGFRVLRNTYRPLEATSIADFWNRYYYYFKELLVDWFFYPAYTRYFKHRPKVRMFAATIAAATVGNMLYHFFRDIDAVWTYGIWKSIVGFRVYAFYTLVLGCGIGISQMRRKKRARGGRWRTQVRPALGVISFFCLVHIFDYTGRDHTITQHMRFLLHLFGIEL